jgi:predicted outer membrane lipoprotein
LNPKTVVLWTLASIQFLSGAFSQYLYQKHMQPIGSVVLGLVLACAFLTFLWYRFDTEQRLYKRTYLLNIGVVGAGLVALPYYFFRSRGAKGGFLASLLLVLFLVGLFLLSWAGRYVVFFATRA